MKKALLLIFFMSHVLMAQNEDVIKEIETYRSEQNKEFKTEGESPLTEKDRSTFKELNYLPIDLDYRVAATFVRTPDEFPFEMKTSTTRKPYYVKYGEVHFEIKGKKLKLNLYQSVPPSLDDEYKNYLFLPFTDLTNGSSTYTNGRYLDVRIPKDDKVILDFNKSYNPYCAYSGRYSCPIPPSENDLDVKIEAGILTYKNH